MHSCKEVFKVLQTACLWEEFEDYYSLLSINFEILIDQEPQMLSLQRSWESLEAPRDGLEEQEEICLVLSPSQACAYQPFKSLRLGRNTLAMYFTAEAAEVFTASSILLEFSLADLAFNELRENIERLSQGQSFYTFVEAE